MAFLTNNQLSQSFDDFYQTDLLGLRSWNPSILESMGYTTRAPGTIRVLPSQPNINMSPLGSAGLGGNQNITFNLPDPLDGPNGDWYDQDDPGKGGETGDVSITSLSYPPLQITEDTPDHFEVRLRTHATDEWTDYGPGFCGLLGGTWVTEASSCFFDDGGGGGGVAESCYETYDTACPNLYQADVEHTGVIKTATWSDANDEWVYTLYRQQTDDNATDWTDTGGSIGAVRNRATQFAPQFQVPIGTRVVYRPRGNPLDTGDSSSEVTFNSSAHPITTLAKIASSTAITAGGETWRWTYTFVGVDPIDSGAGVATWPTVTSDPEASTPGVYPPISGRCYNLMEQENSSSSKRVNNHQAPTEASLTVSAVENNTVVVVTLFKTGTTWHGYFSHPNKVETSCA